VTPPPRNIDPAFATTEDIMKAAGISRQTVSTWISLGLLPAPTKVSLGSPGGVFNRFPAWAVDRARFIAQRRTAGYTIEEVLEMLAELDARQGLSTSKPRTTKGRSSGRR
jgi:DNA-binding transcriptional MerR regulator